MGAPAEAVCFGALQTVGQSKCLGEIETSQGDTRGEALDLGIARGCLPCALGCRAGVPKVAAFVAQLRSRKPLVRQRSSRWMVQVKTRASCTQAERRGEHDGARGTFARSANRRRLKQDH